VAGRLTSNKPESVWEFFPLLKKVCSTCVKFNRSLDDAEKIRWNGKINNLWGTSILNSIMLRVCMFCKYLHTKDIHKILLSSFFYHFLACESFHRLCMHVWCFFHHHARAHKDRNLFEPPSLFISFKLTVKTIYKMHVWGNVRGKVNYEEEKGFREKWKIKEKQWKSWGVRAFETLIKNWKFAEFT
jgi:hypothetical protein